MENIKLIAIYGRVSSQNQENEGTIETQLSAVYEYAKKNGFTIVQKYIDEGWSGDTLIRPALDQLRMDAKKRNWEAVIIYDPDRLARRGAWQEVVMEELKDLDIEVLFVTIPKPKTDEDMIMYKMRGVFTEYERMKINERFRLGRVRKAKEGHIIVSEAPYGYTLIVKNGKKGDVDFHQGYFKINEDEAKIVKDIFKWIDTEGLTLRGVVRRLQDLGIEPRKSKRGVWNTSTLSTLLKNKSYIGEGHYGASYAVIPVNPLKKETYKKIKKTSRRMKPESEWIKVPTPKLIEEDLFYRVGERLKRNFQMSQRNTKNEYLLTGLIWCTCGRRRAGEGPQKGKHLYYRCTDRVYSFPLGRNCNEKGLNARVVDDLVWKKVSEIVTSPSVIKKHIERWINGKKSGNGEPVNNVEIIEKEISKIKDQEDRFNRAYGAGVITIDQLKEYVSPIKEKILLLNEKIFQNKINIQNEKEMDIPSFEEIETFCRKVSKYIGGLNFNAKKAIMKGIIDKAVGTREILTVNGYIPIENINVFTEYRNRRFAKCWEVDFI
jgi:site-specific DNA recombinase